MGLVDSLDAFISVYQIDVCGKKWNWPHYINNVDVLKVAAFKVFRLVNPDAKMDFLTFTHRVAMHYLKAAKVRRQIPSNITYRRQRCWNGNAAVPENFRNQGNHFVEKFSPKQCRVCPHWPKTWNPICKVGVCMEPCFKAFHTWIRL